MSFLDQAKDYYSAAMSSRLTASKPVLTYYAMLNVSKAFILTFGQHPNLDTIWHGLSENNAGTPISAHSLKAYRSTANRLNAFAELYKLIHKVPLASDLTLPINNLFAQFILGHRLWCTAAGRKERFVRIAHIRYMHDSTSHQLWLRLYFFADDLKALHIGHNQLLVDGRFSSNFQQISINEKEAKRRLICFEQTVPIPSTNWPSDKLLDLSSIIKNNIWIVLLNSHPYRRFYSYVAPSSEVVLPQLLSIYALSYYFSSITRYRPHVFRTMLKDSYGSFIREFVDYQITLFTYLLAAEFGKRDVVKPGVI